MKTFARVAALALGLGLSSGACYHAIVETGRPAGATTIQRPWTSTFLWGLVPAEEINTATQCPQGVARVETQMTFPNALVSFVTFGIYTPRSVTVTCASGTGELLPTDRVRRVAEGATQAERDAAVMSAIEESKESGARVFVQF